ncbi:ExbD/TolR family protein [Terrimonas rubra]|uniref:ExbD/TolR family protein n=1 Tax=Terrimonas rubra TaxID=1035890 RepID=A0ABW6A5F6_9BACT
MPRVSLPKKSTDTDMTPFVDIGFLILSFFIMATKFKPAEPVPIETPNSVNADKLPEDNAVLISIDKDNKVYFSALAKKDPTRVDAIAEDVSTVRELNLTDKEKQNFRNSAMVGMPFNKLKSFLDVPVDKQKDIVQDGIPVLDSATNELVYWIAASQRVFAGQELRFLIKGDSKSHYPTFKAVIDALKRNEVFKYNLVTMPEEAPGTSEVAVYRRELEKLKK